MGANIITGYTGTRHITPAMDAAVYRSTFGADSYILSDGNQLAASMPDINSFTILDGLVSMQGHQVQITQETLSIDTCANGYSRIDLVCLRFEHDNGSSVDNTSLVVIKGTEVQDPNTPSVPTHNTGDIDSGATIVDFPLYQLNLSGSTITTTQLAEVVEGTIEGLTTLVLSVPAFSSLPQTVTDDRISVQHVVVNSVLGTPSAQTSDWTVTTSDGSLTIAGSISGSTTLTLYLNMSK